MSKLTITTRDGKTCVVERNHTTEQIKWWAEASDEEREDYDRRYWEQIERTLKKQDMCDHHLTTTKTIEEEDKYGVHYIFIDNKCHECDKSWRTGGNEHTIILLRNLEAVFNDEMIELAAEQEIVISKSIRSKK